MSLSDARAPEAGGIGEDLESARYSLCWEERNKEPITDLIELLLDLRQLLEVEILDADLLRSHDFGRVGREEGDEGYLG